MLTKQNTQKAKMIETKVEILKYFSLCLFFFKKMRKKRTTTK